MRVGRFGRNRHRIEHHHENLFPTGKYGAGGFMVWDCYAPSGSGCIAIINGKNNHRLCEDILQETLRLSNTCIHLY